MRVYGVLNMSKSKSKPGFFKKEVLLEIGKDLLGWLVVTAVSFIYSMVFLLIISLVLVSVWKVTFHSILMYSVVIMVICSVVYAGKMVRDKLHS